MKRRFRRGENVRLLSVAIVLTIAFAGTGFRLFHVQTREIGGFAERGLDQRLRTEGLAADRGTIFDRDGGVLALTVRAVTVYANPDEIDDPATVAAFLAGMVGVDSATLTERLGRDTSFVYVARQLERHEAERVAAADLPGIYFTSEPKRVYPANGLAGQIVGLVKVDDNSGIEGIELEYDDILTGVPGSLIVERDPQGNPIPQGVYAVAPAEPGSDLVLTIDREIQFVAEAALLEAVLATGAAGGTVVVIDPDTGEILAMANVPEFNPNDRSDAVSERLRNRAVTDVYEPGSTQKLITVAAALDYGVVVPEDVFEVPDELLIEDKPYSDVGNHPDVLTVSDIVAYSSNIGTILIQQALGNEAFHAYLDAFGLGHRTGVDFPGEASGVLRPASEWCQTTCGASTAIGYRVSVTALQMAGAFGAIANDGIWIQPHLVKEIVDSEGSRRPVEPRARPVVSQQTAALMRIMLSGVVEKGTGSRARVEGFRVGGKTGTTEKYLPELGGYGDDVVSSFLGMAPIDDPRLVVAVIIDAPANGEFGGEIAAPVFAEIMQAALHQMGVSPDVP